MVLATSRSNLHHVIEGIGFTGLGSSWLGRSGVLLGVGHVAGHAKTGVELLSCQLLVKFIKLA